jgi:DNA-binding response OmpR family regulator
VVRGDAVTGSILFVEDDPALADLVRDYLEAEGFAVETCGDGKLGLERALTGDHDLILLDLMLPGLGGLDILRSFRARWPVPVVVVSARGEDVDKIRGLGLGADDYVSKPFSPAELVARVKAHLARYRRLTGGSARTTEWTAGALSWDPDKKQVRLAGQVLALTAKEQDLLVLFIQNPGRLFGKEELYHRVWGEATSGDVSTVTVHVRRLREKIERDPGEPTILETVWGLGYRLAAEG